MVKHRVRQHLEHLLHGYGARSFVGGILGTLISVHSFADQDKSFFSHHPFHPAPPVRQPSCPTFFSSGLISAIVSPVIRVSATPRQLPDLMIPLSSTLAAGAMWLLCADKDGAIAHSAT